VPANVAAVPYYQLARWLTHYGFTVPPQQNKARAAANVTINPWRALPQLLSTAIRRPSGMRTRPCNAVRIPELAAITTCTDTGDNVEETRQPPGCPTLEKPGRPHDSLLHRPTARHPKGKLNSEPLNTHCPTKREPSDAGTHPNCTIFAQSKHWANKHKNLMLNSPHRFLTGQRHHEANIFNTHQAWPGSTNSNAPNRVTSGCLNNHTTRKRTLRK
jgi:hypothetical protein